MAANAPTRTEEQHTFLMPPRVDAVLMLSVDFDPIDDRIAAIGYRRVEAGNVSNQHVHVPASGSAVDAAEAMVAVLSALVADLTEIAPHTPPLPHPGNGEAGTYAPLSFFQ